MMASPALALLEFHSIAGGIEAGDAMVKRAPVEQLLSGTIQPGYYLVLVTGEVADVVEAVDAGVLTGGDCLRDRLLLPNVHPGVVAALRGERAPGAANAGAFNALGIVETSTVAAAIVAADAGLKGAEVRLNQLRLGDGLGGKGLALFVGLVSDVDAAVALGGDAVADLVVRRTVVSQLHDEMWGNVNGSGRFGDHFAWPPV
ncbi:MAG: BMC domain-containing protein [Anaerolineales bacterium]|uniref:BMC domain-containing protein n=1 Tax=Promineifilum sp. TaxID=2664178 RepID=UPI001D609104|nr:BMC domain-containing protein [Anaerolineales bacterium]MCO5179867.1 BMC domain-containing protein [Promineifilum sp.]